MVSNLFKFATFTYGPLLGLFTFGILTKRTISDKYVWIIALTSIILTYLITLAPSYYSESFIGKYNFHWEILPLNGFNNIFRIIINF